MPEYAIDPERFDKAFWLGKAYALTLNKHRDSPHATAAALSCSVGRNHIEDGLSYLEDEIDSGTLIRRVTPYFACFVSKALLHKSHERSRRFILDFYGPIARIYGSIYEKTSGNASLAHGWSVGIAPILNQSLTDLENPV